MKASDLSEGQTSAQENESTSGMSYMCYPKLSFILPKRPTQVCSSGMSYTCVIQNLVLHLSKHLAQVVCSFLAHLLFEAPWYTDRGGRGGG